MRIPVLFNDRPMFYAMTHGGLATTLPCWQHTQARSQRTTVNVGGSFTVIDFVGALWELHGKGRTAEMHWRILCVSQ